MLNNKKHTKNTVFFYKIIQVFDLFRSGSETSSFPSSFVTTSSLCFTDPVRGRVRGRVRVRVKVRVRV